MSAMWATPGMSPTQDAPPRPPMPAKPATEVVETRTMDMPGTLNNTPGQSYRPPELVDSPEKLYKYNVLIMALHLGV